MMTSSQIRMETGGRRDGRPGRFIGDGFLYKMVRSMVGVLAEIGRNRLPPEIVPELLEARNRSCARDTAPAAGLFLMKVFYENNAWDHYQMRSLPWEFYS